MYPETLLEIEGGDGMKILLKIVVAPLVVLLTLAIWIYVGLIYVSGLVLGLV